MDWIVTDIAHKTILNLHIFTQILRVLGEFILTNKHGWQKEKYLFHLCLKYPYIW